MGIPHSHPDLGSGDAESQGAVRRRWPLGTHRHAGGQQHGHARHLWALPSLWIYQQCPGVQPGWVGPNLSFALILAVGLEMNVQVVHIHIAKQRQICCSPAVCIYKKFSLTSSVWVTQTVSRQPRASSFTRLVRSQRQKSCNWGAKQDNRGTIEINFPLSLWQSKRFWSCFCILQIQEWL